LTWSGMLTNVLRSTLLGAIALPLVYGQTDAARIIGTISDPSGAVIPAASVIVKNERTGDTRKTVTGQNGQYLITQLPPSSYNITVEASGMAKAEYTGVALQVGQERTLDVRMQ